MRCFLWLWPALMMSLLAGTAPAQLSFSSEQVITTATDYVQTLHAADMDADGDPDVLTASFDDSTIAWLENLGGSYSAPRVLTNQAAGALAVMSTDLNGDGLPDVLAASMLDSSLRWFENLGGGNFGPAQLVTNQAATVRGIAAADLDGDGDTDVLAALRPRNAVVWYENLGGGSFGPEKIITQNALFAQGVHAKDLNADGLPDVLTASTDDDKIAWHRNLGGGNFGPQQVISTQAHNARDVLTADLNSDGRPDVLSVSRMDDKLAWYENLGSGNFGPEQLINQPDTNLNDPTNGVNGDADYVVGAAVADLDNNGTLDVLSASVQDDKIAYYLNQGGGSFAPQTVLTTNADDAMGVAAADVDGDGLQDILSASAADDKVAWFRNQCGSNCAQAVAVDTSICPGDTLWLGNQAFTDSGSYTLNLNSGGGPDSLLSLSLSLRQLDTSLRITGTRLAVPAGATSLGWLDCTTGNLIPGESGQQFTPSGSGPYAAVIQANGCTDTTACANVLVTARSGSPAGSLRFRLFPNPSTGELKLRGDFAPGRPLQLRVMDLQGRTLLRRKLERRQIRLDLAKGAYLVEVRQGDHFGRRKLIVR